MAKRIPQNLEFILKIWVIIQQIKSKDSRKKKMKLTEKGYKILDEAIPLWLEAEDQILNESKKFGFSVI